MTSVPISAADDAALIEAAQTRARRLLARSLDDTSRAERAGSRRLARLLADPSGRDLLLVLTDRVMRIRQPKRAAQALRDLVGSGVPTSLSAFDRLGLATLGRIAPAMPRTAERLVDWRVGKDTTGVVLPAEDPEFAEYVRHRRAAGFRLNVNVLGEAILGDDEADARCRTVIRRLQRPDVD